MRPTCAPILLIIACSVVARCAAAAEVQTDVHTSTRNFEKVAACAYGILGAAHPGKVTFSDAELDRSVRMVLQDRISGFPALERNSSVQITIVGTRSGSTIELVSPTFDAGPVWSEIAKCTP